VTTATRSTLLPNVPTVAESGFAGVNIDTWLALVGPRGLPPAVKSRLEKALAEAVADPETRAKLVANGFEPAYSSSSQLSALIADEMPRMRAIAARADIKAE
jgi:tripartite-type tricarboxylate transporter receptor subunit TctC